MPPRCNPSTKTTRVPRRVGRCGTGGSEHEEQLGPDFLIPAYPRHDQSTAKQQSFRGNSDSYQLCQLPQQSCRGQGMFQPWLAPYSNTSPVPARLLPAHSLRTRHVAAAQVSEGTFAFDVETRVPAPRRTKVRRRWRQGELIAVQALLCPGSNPGLPVTEDAFPRC